MITKNPDQLERRRIARRKWSDNNKRIMDKCRETWRINNLDRILQKRRERMERITGRKVIPRGSVIEEEKLLKARIRSARWYHKNKHLIVDKVRQRSRSYSARRGRIILSPIQLRKKLDWQKMWRANNRDKMLIYDIRSRQNVQRLIKNRLRSRVTKVLRRNNIRKSVKTIDLIGCTWATFKLHIECQFRDGMLWGNRKLWHIDHIKPCAAFDLTNPDQQKLCFNYANMQPLWAADNLSKHSKWQEAA